VRGAPELEELAHAWNRMTAALREHQARLVESEKLAGIGRLAAGVAHEINNPLGVILGYAKLLRKKADGAAAADLAVIEEETLRAKEIVDGLLDLSRPMPRRGGAGRPAAARGRRGAAARRGPPARGRRRRRGGARHGAGPPEKLRQVLVNLVRNGAEAAGPGGRVAVRVEEGPGGVEVSVVDSGPGLDPEVRPRLFEPFFTTKPKGTGLGLAVSRAIARAHGGDLAADGATAGGARFALRLPAAERAA